MHTHTHAHTGARAHTHMLHDSTDHKAHYLYVRIRCTRLLTVWVTYESNDMLLGEVWLAATNAMQRHRVRLGRLLCLIVRLRTRRTAEATYNILDD